MLTQWWHSEEWARYERACGCEGERLAALSVAQFSTRVVSLDADRDTLWAGVRKSYRQIIARYNEDQGFGTGTLSDDLFLEVCSRLHRTSAGRQTRPMESWQVQADWIRNGRAVCMVGLRRDAETRLMDGFGDVLNAKAVAFAYVVRDGSWAYYFSGASLERDAMHYLQWSLMLALKDMGVRSYELGWQGEAQDEKGRNIEFFRRGFGGTDVPARIAVN